MAETWQILIASSDVQSRRGLLSALDRQGLSAYCASDVNQCREILSGQNIGLVFCDRFFADGDYRDVLAASRGNTSARARVVLLSVLSDSEQYRKAKEQGVFEVISASCRPTDVEWMVIQARRDELRRGRILITARSEGATREQNSSARRA